MGEETSETGVEQPLESDSAIEGSAAIESAENARSRAATGSGVAIDAIIVFGAVALACILAFTAIAIAFINNAPW